MKTKSRIEPNAKPGVPPSLDPGGLNPLASVLERSGAGRRVLTAGQRALTAMHSAMAELDDAVRAVAGRHGRVTTQPRGMDVASSHSGDVRHGKGGLRAFSGHEGQLVDAARQRFSAVGSAVQAQVDILDDARRDLDGVMASALVDSETPPVVAGEIRRHVARMEPADRLPFLHDRAVKGDKTTLAAVLNAPSYLSGIDEKTRDTITAEARARLTPEAHATNEAAARVYEHVRRAIDTFVGAYHDTLAPLGSGEREVAGKIAALKGGGA